MTPSPGSPHMRAAPSLHLAPTSVQNNEGLVESFFEMTSLRCIHPQAFIGKTSLDEEASVSPLNDAVRQLMRIRRDTGRLICLSSGPKNVTVARIDAVVFP